MSVADGDAAELERIARFLTRPGPRFGLAMVIYADSVLAGEARAQLSARPGSWSAGCDRRVSA